MTENHVPAHPPIVLETPSRRFRLVYPRPEQDVPDFRDTLSAPGTLAHLPCFKPLTLKEAHAKRIEHNTQQDRITLEIHMLVDDHEAEEDSESPPYEIRTWTHNGTPYRYRWGGITGLTHVSTNLGEERAESGIILAPWAVGKKTGLATEVLYCVLDWAFTPLREQVADPPTSAPTYGIRSIAWCTSNRNKAMRGWIEHVLGLQTLTDSELDDEQRETQEAWGEEAPVFYKIGLEEWKGGTRGRLLQRIANR